MRGEGQRSPLTGVITMVALVFLYAPLVIVVLFSFHATGNLSFPWQGFSTRWYREVLASAEFRAAFRASVVVAVSTSVTTLIFGTMAAYGLTRVSGRVRGPLAFLFFLPLTVPGLFIGIGLLSWFTKLDVRASLTTVTVAHLVYVFPYFMLIAGAALDRLDVALEESAQDLGASPWLVFWRVTFPQVWPLLAGATSLAFALSFDEFIITFFVIGNQSTLPMFIWSSLRRTVDPSINVVSTLLMAITLLLWVVAFAFTLRSERQRNRTRDAAVPGGILA